MRRSGSRLSSTRVSGDGWAMVLGYALSVCVQLVRSRGANTHPSDGLGCTEVQRWWPFIYTQHFTILQKQSALAPQYKVHQPGLVPIPNARVVPAQLHNSLQASRRLWSILWRRVSSTWTAGLCCTRDQQNRLDSNIRALCGYA